MIRITDFSKYPLALRTADFEVGSGDDALFSLRGRDRLGKRWRLALNDAVRGAWRSDLNGSQTYYFAGYTGGAGSAPGTWILALSFDEERRPVPFLVVTHGSYDEHGVEDVLNLDGRGAELLQQDYWGNIMDDPGHYVTTLYEQRNSYWYRSDGIHGAHTFPAFEKWSVMWHGRPAVLVERPHTDRTVRDWGNDPRTGVRTQIVSTGENGALRIRPAFGCTDVTATRVRERLD